VNIDVTFIFRRWPKGWMLGGEAWVQHWHTLSEDPYLFSNNIGTGFENMAQFYDAVVGVRV